MQRAGVLLAVNNAAHDTRSTTLEGIARAYSASLRRLVPVPEESAEDVLGYVREQRLWKRYAALREKDALPAGTRIELQDLWLADPRLPAATGAITDDVIDEPPQLAASVRLIRGHNFTRTDRGRALLALLGDDANVLLPQHRDGAATPNLLRLDPGTRVFLAYTLLDADLDFVRVAYEVAPIESEEFTRAEFADTLNAACRLLRTRWTRRARSGTDRRLLARLDEWARQIDKPRRSGKQWGGGRPPDQLATLRLEPYVDLGLLTRLNRTAYRYRLTPAQRTFFDELLGEDDPGRFLNERLVRSVLAGNEVEAERVPEEDIWLRVETAYNRLKSVLGFASFEEVALLAVAQLVNEGGGRYFEVGDGLEAIRRQQKREPRRVRFGVRRGGGLTYMKIVDGKGQ